MSVNAGATKGKGIGCFILKPMEVGVFTEIEQQLQTQKGEQLSSPQPFECWSWSEI